MSLPILCSSITVRAMLDQEAVLVDLATGFVASGAGDIAFAAALGEHLAAIAHLNEIAYFHESDSPCDRDIHASVMQVKAWHLAALEDAFPL